MTAPPLDLSHHFSYPTRHREASSVKDFYKYFQIPGIGNLAGGLPNSSYFPFDTLEAQVARPQRFDLTTNNAATSEHLTVPKESQTDNPPRKIDLTTALQYGTAQGYPALYTFLRRFTRSHLHPNVPYAGGPDIVLSCGSTDGFSKAVEAFTNVWNPDRDYVRHREGVLCEEFAYMNAIQTAKPRGLNIVGVAMDEQGMRVEGRGGLAEVLDCWDFRYGRRPHLMYTVTTGQNPTGTTLSIDRKREIYALCQKYDIIIVEDDPYWNLQFPSSPQHPQVQNSSPRNYNYNSHGHSSGYDFLDSLIPSYLSLDIDGRVVRLDTFSKTIAPGCRLGWITAQPAIIERLTRITETSTQQPSGFVQSLVAELLLGQGCTHDVGSSWQMDGWVRWLEGLRGDYERRMQTMSGILEEGMDLILDSPSPSPSSSDTDANTLDVEDWSLITKAQIYNFARPSGGMFIWLRVNLSTHPLAQAHKYTSQQLSRALWKHLTREPYLCLVGPGGMFATTSRAAEEAVYFMRLCFAAMPESEVAGVSRRLVRGFREFWERRDLDDLLDEDAFAGLEVGKERGLVGFGVGC